MAGDAETGVCIMRLTAGLDTGPVAAREATAIHPTDTYATLAERLREIAGRLLVAALDAGPGGLRFAEQPEAGVTYAEKIGPEDRMLTGHQDAAAAARRVRALAPHIGAAVALPGGERLGVWAAHARPGELGDPPRGDLALHGDTPVLGCADETVLVLDEVQPAGKRAMDGAAFLRGRPR